jgi:hypothetical protein
MTVVVAMIAAALWAAFGIAALVRPSVLDVAWGEFCAVPFVLKIIAGVVLLPWIVALAIWQGAWPRCVRITTIVVVAATSTYLLVPR